jgi:glutamate synthase (ferredoxin)
VIGAVLDRNGLRPARYYVTKDDLVVLASEVGVLDIPAEDIVVKERLHPGRMFLVDTAQGRIISDDEVKDQLAREHPADRVVVVGDFERREALFAERFCGVSPKFSAFAATQLIELSHGAPFLKSGGSGSVLSEKGSAKGRK